MQISIDIILLNLYYSGVALALLVRDILWLRIIIVLSGVSLITYGILTANTTVIIWNILFFAINIYQIIFLLIQRKSVDIDEELLPLYNEIFSAMRKSDFLGLWKIGTINSGENQVLCRAGSIQENLYLILEGEAAVKKNGKNITTLTRGDFIGEISFFTGKAASADVVSKGSITYIFWNHQMIRKIKWKNPEMYEKLYQILTADISEKLSQSGI